MAGIAVSVDYRLAPEHPWPAALDDCRPAQTWLQREDRAFGLDASRLIIGGQSAGGGLAAALVLRTTDAGGHVPLLHLLSYPMIDDRTMLRRQTLNVKMWDETSNRLAWRSYLGREPGGAEVSDLVAPARRTHLHGLPPSWNGVGTEDLFHDENLSYAQRLKGAGVACSLEVVDGAFHGFDTALPDVPVSQRFFAAQCAAIRRALAESHVAGSMPDAA